MGRSPKTVARPAEAEARLPHRYTPRPYQVPFWRAMLGGQRYAALVWHRRSGKDTSAFNWLLVASQARVGNYYYLFPTFAQGRRVLWEGMNREGMRLLDHIPGSLIVSKNETDMRVVVANGSAVQIVGTDNFDSHRGGNPVGLVFSEYAKQNPAAWPVFAPILEENGGWAVFVYTPLGRNHGYDLWEMARHNPEWFAQRLTIDDTGVFDDAFLTRMRAQGHDETYLQQEYYTSFTGAVQGSFYAPELAEAFAGGRVTRIPYDPRLPVETAWDIGTTKDATAIWFYQQAGAGRVHLIDYHEETHTNLQRLSRLILHEKPYAYRAGVAHIAPHDIARTEFSTGRTVRELARDVRLEFRVVPKQNHWERVMAARALFPRCYFDQGLCQKGLAALAHYHRAWDETTKSFSAREHPDWSNHGADAFGHLAVGLEPLTDDAPMLTHAETAFDPWNLDARPAGRAPRVESEAAPFGGR